MKKEKVLKVFKEADALLEGHFILSSGRHSRQFLQKAFVFMNPAATEKLCKALAEKISKEFGKVDYIVSPAVGGIIPGYETARHLGAKAVFVEREDGVFKLRRGFELPKKAKVVVVEDIVSTGLSIRETIDAIKDLPIKLKGAAVIIDRSNGTSDVGIPLISLAAIDIESFAEDEIPEDLKDIPAIKPGSRALSKAKEEVNAEETTEETEVSEDAKEIAEAVEEIANEESTEAPEAIDEVKVEEAIDVPEVTETIEATEVAPTEETLEAHEVTEEVKTEEKTA